MSARRHDPLIWWADRPPMTLSDRLAYDLARERARLTRIKTSYRRRNR